MGAMGVVGRGSPIVLRLVFEGVDCEAPAVRLAPQAPEGWDGSRRDDGSVGQDGFEPWLLPAVGSLR